MFKFGTIMEKKNMIESNVELLYNPTFFLPDIIQLNISMHKTAIYIIKPIHKKYN